MKYPVKEAMAILMREVQYFHDIVNPEPSGGPEWPSHEECVLRDRLLREEVMEYEEAVADGDLVNISDAIADIIYVLLGTALTYGVPLHLVFAEVCRSNREKFPDGEIILDDHGKVQKPEGWDPPDIDDILRGCHPPLEDYKIFGESDMRQLLEKLENARDGDSKALVECTNYVRSLLGEKWGVDDARW